MKERMRMAGSAYKLGQRVEVWFAGWDQWIGGEVREVGFLDGVACVRVLLDADGDTADINDTAIFRVDQVRAMEGLFA